MKNTFFLLAALSSVASMGCGGAAVNSGANNSNTNKAAMPTLTASATPGPPDVNLPTPVPGGTIPPPANAAPGTTPTPRNPKTASQRPGATPTPGIPSPEELRKQMSTPRSPNDAPPGNSAPMMKGVPMMKTTKTPHP
ncbi:MAG: hypothetical protein JO053_01535 [Acidobacteria bacterium]|nr:hypothetical protein [Acidobacteriota bacterium]